ncbi:MAG: hypothetical protein CMD20_04535 [Flavobacteriales bacterium]|nr:hypothetical protein [Flavobacteriales bacterium]
MMKNIFKKSILFLFGLILSAPIFGQIPDPAMVGYWENWQGNRFVKLKNIDSRYNVIQISFAEEQNGRDYDLGFDPAYSEEEFRTEMQALQAEGKKVLISIGGQNAIVMLDSAAERDIFVSSVNEMIDEWGFDGLDIDLEGASLGFTDIHVQNPGDVRQQYLIEAIGLIMKNHYEKHGVKLLLTMAPETLYVQGGLSTSSSKRGAYLPIIEALRDSIDMLNVQLYNSGSQFGLDGLIYNQGSADWILAMTDAVIQGFECKNNLGTYSGLPAYKVGVGLPGCHSSDAVPHKEMEAAMRYLIGEGPQPGSYELIQDGGYPDLRGMMTWSINSDKTCGPSYGFVDTYSKVFTDAPYIEINNISEIYESEEDGKIIEVELFNDNYTDSLDSSNWTIANLPEGVEIDSIQRINDTIAHVVFKGNASSPYTSTNFKLKVTVDSTEFVNSDEKLSRNHGVILKPAITQIPGYLELEKYVDFKGCGVGNISEQDGGGKYGWIWENQWAEVEANIAESGDYVADFRYRTSSGTHKCILKVDGGINSINTINSSTAWNVWENKEFNVKLTEGVHKLRFHMSKGWVHLDRVDFRITSSDNSFTIFNRTFFYPNPASQILTFDNERKGTVNIFGIRGELVKQVSLNETNQINIGDLKTGIYTVQLIDLDGAMYHDKLVKK